MEKPEEVSNVGRIIKVLSFEEKTKGIFKQKDEEIQKLKDENEELKVIIAKLQEPKSKKVREPKPEIQPEKPLNEILEPFINNMIKEGKVSYAVIKNKTEKYLLPSEKTTLEFILQATVKLKTGFRSMRNSNFVTGILSGHEEFVKGLNIDERTIRSAIKSLEEKKLILRYRFTDKSYLYFLNIPKSREIFEMVSSGKLSLLDCEQLNNLIRGKKKTFFEIDPDADLKIKIRSGYPEKRSARAEKRSGCAEKRSGHPEKRSASDSQKSIDSRDLPETGMCTNSIQTSYKEKQTYIGDPILNSENFEPFETENENAADVFLENFVEEEKVSDSENVLPSKFDLYKILLENGVWENQAKMIIENPVYLSRIESQLKAMPYRKAKNKGKVLLDSIVNNWEKPKELIALEEKEVREAEQQAKSKLKVLGGILNCDKDNFQNIKENIERFKETFCDFNEKLEFHYRNSINVQISLRLLENEESITPKIHEKLSKIAMNMATNDRDVSLNKLSKVLKIFDISDEPNQGNIEEVLENAISKVNDLFSMIPRK